MNSRLVFVALFVFLSFVHINAKSVSQKDVGIRLEKSDQPFVFNRVKREGNRFGLNNLRSDHQFANHEKPEHLPTPAESKKLYKAGKKILGLTITLFIVLVIILPVIVICGLVALCCYFCQ